MTARKTLTFWVIAVLLFGWWWAIERVPEDSKKSAEIKRERFVTLFRDEVEAIEISRDGRVVRAVRDEEKRWKAVEPEGIVLPHDLVVTLIDSLSEEQDAEVVNEKPNDGDLSAFGLDEPRTEVTLEFAAGKKMKIQFGAANPPHTAIYARKDVSPAVYLVGLNLQYYGDLLMQAAFPNLKLRS